MTPDCNDCHMIAIACGVFFGNVSLVHYEPILLSSLYSMLPPSVTDDQIINLCKTVTAKSETLSAKKPEAKSSEFAFMFLDCTYKN